CITLTAAVFAGAISLLMSITSRHAYTVVLRIIVGYMIAFVALPALIGLLSRGATGFFQNIMFQGNPFMTMYIRTTVMWSLPGRAGIFSSWPLHCAIMLAATTAVVSLAVWRVRKVVLKEAFGGAEQSKIAAKIAKVSRRRHRRASAPIRRVAGAPVVWKEMRKPFSRRGKRDIILYAVLAGMIILIFIPMLFTGAMPGGSIYILFIYLMGGFSLIVIVRLAVLSAASITSEKEAGTWPILLATPLEDTEILRGKAIAAFRRNLPLLLVLVALRVVVHLLGSFAGPFPFYSWLNLIPQIITLAGTVVLVIGLGLYFSVRLKSTSAAIAATVGVYVGFAYFCCGMFSSLLFIPFTLWWGSSMGVGVAMRLVQTAFMGLIFAGLGIFALRRAKRRLRCNIF
ncbi:MAG: ABC transporter permease subunit, partial [Mariprofundaceae bacterium]|nr:ABC transporter permease subunit [Mariprofundaceae bacterium]